MWVIGELEDKGNTLHQEFTVSTPPQKWIHIKDGVLKCHWPKTNTALKIRSCADPIPESKEWTVYNCRLLMKGEIFKTYKEAKEAEKISQNFSTFTEYNAQSKQKQNLKRQLENEPNNFENKILKAANPDVGGNIGGSTLDPDEFSLDSSDTDDEMELIGNDSYEYNERIKSGGAYMTNVHDSDTPDEEETFDSKKTESTQKEHDLSDVKSDGSDQESDFSSQFKFNSDIVFTSTLLEEGKFVKMDEEKSIEPNPNLAISSNTPSSSILTTNFFVESKTPESNEVECDSNQVAIDDNTSSRIESQILKIDNLFSSFVNNAKQELQTLKELFSVNSVPLVPDRKADKVTDVSTSEVGRKQENCSEILKSLEENHAPKAKSPKFEILNVEVLAPIMLHASNDVVLDSPTGKNTVAPNDIQVATVAVPIVPYSEIVVPISNKPHFEKVEDLLKKEELEGKEESPLND